MDSLSILWAFIVLDQWLKPKLVTFNNMERGIYRLMEAIPIGISAVSNFGFPIVMTFYLFIRFEKKIDKLENVIVQLSNVIKDSIK
ncbi:YvrJ family protein [Ornithinibacillus scapharcae]|uniref:YvrJ family protein n=1 Tax=Ornithinibacillus scapharcae TaxID=1147159 RepID=UPI000225BD6E